MEMRTYEFSVMNNTEGEECTFALCKYDLTKLYKQVPTVIKK